MADTVSIERLTEFGGWFEDFKTDAAAEGFAFVARLFDEWHAGINRFGRAGEYLALARAASGAPAGICGLNRDPYTNDAGIGRLRHLYVRPVCRGRGIGAALVENMLMLAKPFFHRVQLRTDSVKAAQFYCKLGFIPCCERHATHYASLPAR